MMNKHFIYYILLAVFSLLPGDLPAQSIIRTEYWFDDDLSTLVGKNELGSESYVVVSDVSTDGLTDGVHQFNFRVQQSDGYYSPIHSRTFIKTNGGLSKLIYWFDHFDNPHREIEGQASGSTVAFLQEADLSDVSEGVHRLYYCGVNSNGAVCTAISSVNVMVKSKYIREANTAKVVQYSFSIDDETPMVMDVLNPSEEITIPYTLDTRGRTAGEHTLKTIVWNSFGTSIVKNITFNVAEREEPTITLEVSEKNGIVTASFNSIPNDQRYRVIRKDEGGNKAKVGDFEVSYPNVLSKTDEPMEGTYTYYVQAIYTDHSGNSCLVTSNEVVVTVAKSEDTSEPKAALGSIIGSIKIANQQQTFMPLNLQMDVTFSDGEVIKSGVNGMFIREGIPVGTKLSMTVKNNPNYTFDSPSVVVDENTRKTVCVITATPVEKETEQVVEKDNESYDLLVNSEITGIPDQFNFEVKNNTQKSWSGSIYLIAVKEKEDKHAEDVLLFTALTPYHKVGSVSISNLGRGMSTPVELHVTDFPAISKNTFYNFYLVSRSDGTQGVYKLLESVSDLAMNPKRIEMEKSIGEKGLSDEEIAEEVNKILGYMKKFEDYGGQFEKALKTYDETRWFDMSNDDHKVLQAFTDELSKKIKAVGKVNAFFDECKTFYDFLYNVENWKAKDDFDKFIIIMNKACELTGPYAKIYKVYMTALEKTKDAIDKILLDWLPLDVAHLYANYQMRFNIKVKKQANNFFGIESYYSGAEVQKAIRNVEIHLWTMQTKDLVRPYEEYTPESKQLVIAPKVNSNRAEYGALVGNGDTDGMKFWMKIHWANGRISIVPLLNNKLVKYKSNTEVTITFRSESSEMADIIHLEPVEDE